MLTNYSNKSKAPKSNITKDEREALCNLKKDNDHMFLTADKGVALVVKDKDTYIEKCMTLLNDHKVYQECKDLTKPINAKVIKQLTDLKQFRSRVQKPIPKTVAPGDNSPPARFYGLPKIHKPDVPLRPTIFFCLWHIHL